MCKDSAVPPQQSRQPRLGAAQAGLVHPEPAPERPLVCLVHCCLHCAAGSSIASLLAAFCQLANQPLCGAATAGGTFASTPCLPSGGAAAARRAVKQ